MCAEREEDNWGNIITEPLLKDVWRAGGTAGTGHVTNTQLPLNSNQWRNIGLIRKSDFYSEYFKHMSISKK